MQEVTVYSMKGCSFCEAAKALLSRRGVSYREVVLSQSDEDAWRQLTARSGMKTVPQIFHGERLIGGFTELAAVDRTDALISLKTVA